MPKGKKKAPGTERPVDALKHKDARTNIPTSELRDFVKDDEKSPKTVLYPRDTSLDPQLVWKGKDEQNARDLSVPAVPIYIQEKIHPQAIVEEIRRASRGNSGTEPLSLFGDFNGLDEFSKKVDFYHHAQHWSNRMVLGDSLLVMTSLAEKEGLKGKVQCVYIDPPYGIKFGSNWQVSTRNRDVKDGKSDGATRQPEQVRAFRDTWALGVHSFLAYLRDRLVAARELLAETGSAFVQIGDENMHLVRSLMDEVFGPENFISCINFQTMTPLESGRLENVFDYLLWYARDKSTAKYRNLVQPKGLQGNAEFRFIDTDDKGGWRELTEEEMKDVRPFAESGRLFKRSALESSGFTASCTFPFTFEGRTFTPRGGKSWRTNEQGMKNLAARHRLFVLGTKLYFRLYYRDFPFTSLLNTWTDTVAGFSETKKYVVQTHPKIIQRCLLMTTDPGDLVLDPTCGSGTTAHVAEQWGRRWITADTSRVALALARTRLMAARFPYYLLADSEEGARKERELTATPVRNSETMGDVRRGFVNERVPHVTLKSIANNPEIRDGMTRAEMSAAITRNAETEMLVDRPYEDGKRVRVAGPFTVESLSPHRVLPTDAERPESERAPRSDELSFTAMILENLRKAGIRGTTKDQRLTFERLEARAGLWIHGEGEASDVDGKRRRVAVAIGPEHGTVGPELIKEAAKEAVRGVGYDLLVVCGFAFDAHVAEEVKEYGKLRVLIARMNPDLAMGDDLLKKTGAGNLFMVFGEPDVEIREEKDGFLVAEVRGVDVYDPTTGAIRSSSTDDIACWFLDTDYDGESFFVRHAYFCNGGAKGDEGPYDKLKKALRAEIDEAAWSSLYSTSSRPFGRPASKKIAVKVINHYGDEVLKVIAV